jgi:hypothetical protein
MSSEGDYRKGTAVGRHGCGWCLRVLRSMSLRQGYAKDELEIEERSQESRILCTVYTCLLRHGFGHGHVRLSHVSTDIDIRDFRLNQGHIKRERVVITKSSLFTVSVWSL